MSELRNSPDRSTQNKTKIIEEKEKEKNDVQHHNIIIGHGKSGSLIFTAKQKSSMKVVAIKEISKKGKTIDQIDDIRDKITMYKLAQHHNVVKLEDYFEQKDKIYMCLELHSNRNLHDYILRNDFDERKLREIAVKIS